MVLHDLGAQQAPGWMTLVLVAALLVALVLLFLNMRKHLRTADYADLPSSAEVREKQASEERRPDAGGRQG
ncbi:hypothetical protein [Propioniciclava flava]|uniref:hypothetical protein n=1 Tax=Propioniciclava flava TaxID=2072026 RepID=UPI001010BE53|nr:hypothetical protein [Propioniciclava flava]